MMQRLVVKFHMYYRLEYEEFYDLIRIIERATKITKPTTFKGTFKGRLDVTSVQSVAIVHAGVAAA